MDKENTDSVNLSAARTSIWSRKQKRTAEKDTFKDGEHQNKEQDVSLEDEIESGIEHGEIRAQKKNSKIDYKFLRVNIVGTDA